MNRSMTIKLAGLVAVAAITGSLAACSSNPSPATACSLPQGPNLERAISAARFDLETGCEHKFDAYYQRLLSIAEGDPKKENKAAFSDFLLWTNDAGLLSKRQARERYNRYFGVKYVSLVSDYSVCSQTCPRQSDYQETELVLQATCEACGPVE